MITRKSTGRLKSYRPNVVTLELTASSRKDPFSDRITHLKQRKSNPSNSLRKEKIDLLLQSIDFSEYFGATIGSTTFKQESNHSKTSYQVYKQEQFAKPKHSNKINQGKRQQSRSSLKYNKSKGFEPLSKWQSSKDNFGMSSVLIGSLLIENQQSPSTIGESIQTECLKRQMRQNKSRIKMNDTYCRFSISGNNTSFKETLPDTIKSNFDLITKRMYVPSKKLNRTDKIGKGAIRLWTANHIPVKY